MIAIIPIANGQPLDLAPDAEFEKFFKGLRGLRLDERVPSQGKALIDGSHHHLSLFAFLLVGACPIHLDAHAAKWS